MIFRVLMARCLIGVLLIAVAACSQPQPLQKSANPFGKSANLSVYDLCVLADEHISNIPEAKPRIEAMGYTYWDACKGVKAPNSYNHMSRDEYLVRRERAGTSVAASPFTNETLAAKSDLDLCKLAAVYSISSAGVGPLYEQMSARGLSPVLCEAAMTTEIETICFKWVSVTDEMTYESLAAAKHKNAETLMTLKSLGRSYDDCQRIEKEEISVEEFNIDRLKITVTSDSGAEQCVTGSTHLVLLEGMIGPDSSFAVERLIERLPACKSGDQTIASPISVSFKSDGGFLEHGYLLGNVLREAGATTLVENGSVCASSCAVAFLGGTKRIIEETGSILFHAPYFSGLNEYGRRDISCNVGQEALDELKSYYQSITDDDTGERLFERTMWYCSAEDGWVVTGGSAAELYGIATEK